MMVGGAVVAVGTVVEDAVTGGWGTWNDPASFGAAGTLVLGGAALMAEGIREDSRASSIAIPDALAESSGRDYVYHATSARAFVEELTRRGAAAIDYENHGDPEARFGLAFYVAEDPGTALAETKFSAEFVVKFSMDKRRILGSDRSSSSRTIWVCRRNEA
ncbi:hypothetical protein STHERM_c00670 [Spirochaeta thermophila DSM 6192]|uniref:Uncharacterized protein n=2 Tax=Winmispira thermophila TaxID=154 RepID=E0RTY7_WINT6|nr:hypothetical protein STHERM_c00670 [Spirochaeta thermophila DSM 6192]